MRTTDEPRTPRRPVTSSASTPVTTPAPTARDRGRIWTWAAAVEAVAAAGAVLLDLLIPTIVLLAMAAASLLARHRGLGSLGLHPITGRGLALKMLAFAALWSVLQLGVTKPIANHVSGEQQDLGAFAGLEGDLTMLVGYLVLGWTLAAFAEELAYRGYLLTRVREALGGGRPSLVAAVVVSSLLFGLAHSEQGPVGVLIVTLDGLAWSALRLHYKTLWAPILAHGFNNTLGFITFFFAGPVYGLW
jgi:membrane protease YdiL (CAAX protease family)